VRAVCEAIGYAARDCLDTAGLSGTLALCGGGTRSVMWARLMADVLGRPVRIPSEEQVGALGVVTVARASLDPGYRATPGRHRVVEPRADLRALYEDGYARYRAELTTARAGWGGRAR
ncbi:carbohydrate kinase, partial [Streptomyces sp. SID10692]|uniref:FGGY-family carbohydrate kinase n=1 Tax=Streptomyces sp. SID10692 TaxID=2706026 RepID=UPI001410567E|nr:carbohydrate kinase [Streptomyces sp. SID10692]